MEVPLNQDARTSNEDESGFGLKADTDSDLNELGLKPRRRHFHDDIVPVQTKKDNGDGDSSENDTYLNKYGGAVEDLNIPNILNLVQNRELVIANNAGGELIDAKSERIEEEEMTEEEVVVLEFEKAITKLHTHTMHCPNCNNQITKVTLRQKIITKQPQVTVKQHEPWSLLGCLSCFSLFTCTDNGGCIPFWPFGDKEPSDAVPQGPQNDVVGGNGNCFSIFNPFRRKQSGTEKVDPLGQADPTIIDIPSNPPATHEVPTAQTQDSTSFEILKSIVYGGLMEVIASLSIVASAAAGDTTTLNLIALAFANLIGGIFIIGHNLWDLKEDCYKFSTQQTRNEQDPRIKYKELLGNVEHFPMHAFFAILSFVVFGIIPPVIYGYSFNETYDKDLTMVVVAVASFVCVALLATFKAYIDRCTGFWGYVKIIMYYLTTAVTVSGVSYAAGNLAKRLIEEFGWFDTSSNVAMTVLPEVGSMNPSLAYY